GRDDLESLADEAARMAEHYMRLYFDTDDAPTGDNTDDISDDDGTPVAVYQIHEDGYEMRTYRGVFGRLIRYPRPKLGWRRIGTDRIKAHENSAQAIRRIAAQWGRPFSTLRIETIGR